MTTYRVVNGNIIADQPRGWYCYEDVGFAFLGGFDFSLASWDKEKAREMVAIGTHRWKLGHSMRLVLAPFDSELGLWEDWLIEISPGKFRVER